MKTLTERPNIFKVSTKELSQDAFIVWLLQWANPACADLDPILHRCGTDFLHLLTNNAISKERKIKEVEAGRQWDKVDVWAEIHYENHPSTLLIIEDKTFSGEHSDQLNRYKKQGEDYCTEHGYELLCAYFKIGSEPLRSLKVVQDKGFHVVSRKEIKACLANFVDAQHSLLLDFIDYIDGLDSAHQKFETVPLKDWQGTTWVGFYQFVEANLEIITWHKVNNPSGGFWNMCLTWRYWKGIPVYMQTEERKLCFKIAPGKVETGFDMSDQAMNQVQDEALRHLMDFAANEGVSMVKRPHPLVHRGNYRTFAVIDFEDWCGQSEALLDKEKVLAKLQEIIAFYHRYMDNLTKTEKSN